jgi:hypothetical protein
VAFGFLLCTLGPKPHSAGTAAFGFSLDSATFLRLVAPLRADARA